VFLCIALLCVPAATAAGAAKKGEFTWFSDYLENVPKVKAASAYEEVGRKRLHPHRGLVAVPVHYMRDDRHGNAVRYGGLACSSAALCQGQPSTVNHL